MFWSDCSTVRDRNLVARLCMWPAHLKKQMLYCGCCIETAVWMLSGFQAQLLVPSVRLARILQSSWKRYCVLMADPTWTGACVSPSERTGVISWCQGQSSLSCGCTLQSTVNKKLIVPEKSPFVIATAGFHSQHWACLCRCYQRCKWQATVTEIQFTIKYQQN